MRTFPTRRLLTAGGVTLVFFILLFSLMRRDHGMTASWYGDDWHGKLTASGEYFDMYNMTAAHKTLPLGTQLEVNYPGTGKSITVTITDRGPYIPGRDLDLSFGAARQLGMVSIGVARVQTRITGHDRRYDKYLHQPPPVATGFSIEAGVFSDPLTAQALCDTLNADYRQLGAHVQPGEQGMQHVFMGNFSERVQAAIVARELRSNGYEAFIREKPWTDNPASKSSAETQAIQSPQH